MKSAIPRPKQAVNRARSRCQFIVILPRSTANLTCKEFFGSNWADFLCRVKLTTLGLGLSRFLAPSWKALGTPKLVRRIADLIPGINPKSIPAIIWDLDKRFPDKVYKPARGVFRVRKFVEDQNQPAPTPPVSVPVPARIEERAFYEAVADYLMKELEECTKAIPLGGNRFRDKWGTPDVIGVLKASPTDVLKFSEQIVSAEIKVDSADLITAFGQACAYKLFSHRSYIVVPRNSPAEDIARLDALCLIFGIGLILFDASNISAPDFQIRARAVRHEPDMFYVNKNIPDDVR